MNMELNIKQRQRKLLSQIHKNMYREKYSSIQFRKENKAEIMFKDVVDYVCLEFDIDSNLIKYKTKKSDFVKARQISMFFMKKITKRSLEEISGYFNQKHCNALYAINTIQGLIDIKDKKYYEKIKNIEHKLMYRYMIDNVI